MADKLFRDVFPDVKLGPLEDLVGQAIVTDIHMLEQAKTLDVYIKSKNLISREELDMVEGYIARTIFSDEEVTCNIWDTYDLSSQYNLATITDMYKDSLLLEVKHTSYVDYRILKRGEWIIRDDMLTILVEDTAIAREHTKRMIGFLANLYDVKFGITANIEFEYSADKNTQHRLANEIKLKQELASIERRNAQLNAEKPKEEANTATSIEQGDTQVAKQMQANATETVKADSTPKAVGDSVPKAESVEGKEAKAQEPKPDKKPTTSKKEGGFKGKGKTAKSQDPDVIFGNNVEGDIISISDVTEGGPVCIRGQILNIEDRQLKNGKFIISANITDFTDTIAFKIFVSEDDRKDLLDDLKKGNFYIIKGVPAYDSYAQELTISFISGIKPINDFREFRMDNSIDKRVELHLHTVMSEMDSVVDIGKVIKRAKEWGHKAVAITDHGNVQAFPIANHCVKPDEDFKVIYGVEGYFVDDLKDLIQNDKGQSIDSEYVVFDIETTGLSPKFNKIIEIGAVRIKDGKIVDTFSRFINPEVPIPYSITKLTSINDSMVLDSPSRIVAMSFCGPRSCFIHLSS